MPIQSTDEEGNLGVDSIAKALGLLTAMAVGTGILADASYFFVLDRHFFHLMVLSDHVESAAITVPYLLMYLGMLGFALWFTQRYPAMKVAVWAMAPTVWIAMALGIWLWSPSAWARIASGLWVSGLFGFLLFTGVALFGLLRERLSVAEFVTAMVCLWVGLTIWKGATDAFLAMRPDRFTWRPPSQFTVNNDQIVTGGIIRLLDRGAIVLSEADGRLMFIPKDQIRRIDVFPPTFVPGTSRGRLY